LEDTTTATFCPGRWLTAATSETTGTLDVVAAAEALAATKNFAEPVANGGSPATSAPIHLSTRSNPFAGRAAPLVLPEANVVTDTDPATLTTTGFVASDPLPFPVWQQPGNGTVVTRPVRAGDVLVVGDTAGAVTALDPRTGVIRWRTRLPHAVMALAVDPNGRTVAVLDRSGRLTLFDVGAGATAAEGSAGADPIGMTFTRDGTLVVATKSGVVGFDTSGEVIYRLDASLRAGPAPVGNRVAVADSRGQVLVVSPDGRGNALDLDGLQQITALAGADERVAVLDGAHVQILDSQLRPVMRADDDASSIDITGIGKAIRITTTALDGTSPVYDGNGILLHRHAAPRRAPGATLDARQHSDATTLADMTLTNSTSTDNTPSDATWISGVTGVLRFEGTS
jgi:WD40 repeat protein